MVKLKLTSKISLYFFVVSVIPIVITNYLLVTAANNQLLNAASARQAAVASNLSESVSRYLINNVNNLNYLAQIYTNSGLASSDSSENIPILIKQNSDIKRIAVVNSAGIEISAFDANGRIINLSDVSGSDAFKAVSFLGGNEYLSSVNYGEDSKPTVVIAVPIFSQGVERIPGSASPVQNTLTAEDVQGFIIAEYNINNLWNKVLSTKIGDGGYAYVVDGLGNLVAHPDIDFTAKNQKLSEVEAVKQFVFGDFKTLTTISETGKKVVSTPKVIPDSGWAIIVQEPLESVYKSINSYEKLAVTIGFATIAIIIVVIVFFRRQITEPIKKLSVGAKKIGTGQFDYKIDINSRDELQTLAETFNNMGQDIDDLVNRLKENNLRVDSEKSKLAKIINSTTDGIISIDKNGIITSINPPAVKLVNLSSETLIGKKLVEVFRWEKNNEPLEIDVTKPGVFEYNEVILSSDGHDAFLDLVVSVLDRDSGQVGAIITIHDLTRSRELEFMKLDFVAIAAHELRTPLTVIRGYMDLMNTEAINELSIYNIENLQKMIYGTDELRSLINKLLSIARIERGEMEIFIEKLNIIKHVEENVQSHQSTAVYKKQKLKFESSIESTLYVPADPSSITEVLNNLIGNAIKFTEPNGEIIVSITADEQQVTVYVKDNGPGIPEELHSKLFTKFYRAERSLISGSRGTGLGLFISKTIINLQHGKIGIMRSRGKGSTFYFTLPIYKPEVHDKLILKSNHKGVVHGWFKKSSNS